MGEDIDDAAGEIFLKRISVGRRWKKGTSDLARGWDFDYEDMNDENNFNIKWEVKIKAWLNKETIDKTSSVWILEWFRSGLMLSVGRRLNRPNSLND